MDEFANAVADFQATMNKKVAELEADIERHKEEYLTADELVATMYEAVTGNNGGPKRGVVEDVQDVVAELVAERDLFKKESLALASHAEKFRLGLERVIDAGSEGCCKYCDIKTDIAEEALEI
jgi:hypothetical protein